MRTRIEYVIESQLEDVETQLNTLAQYVKYHGVTFTDFLFELKRVIFENNLAS